MDISKVKTAKKMGEFKKRDDHKTYKIKFEFLENISRERKKDRIGRVYFFVVNNIIKKIGGSGAKGGIEATLKLYTDYGTAGRNRFALHFLIKRELDKNNKVEVWMTTSPKVPGKISGLYDVEDGMIAAYMEMEDKCKSEYKSSESIFPEWNWKERGEKMPIKEMEEYVKHMQDYVESYEDEDED